MNQKDITAHLVRVAKAFDVTHSLILSRARSNDVAFARFALCRILREEGVHPLAIARLIKRDVSSVSHALRQHTVLMEVNSYYISRFQRLSSSDGFTINWVLDRVPMAKNTYLVACRKSDQLLVAVWDGHAWSTDYSVFAWAELPARPSPAEQALNNKTER